MTRADLLRRRGAVPLLACALFAPTMLASCGDSDRAPAAKAPANTADRRPFAATSPWNARVDTAPVADGSATAVRLAATPFALTTTSAGDVRRVRASRPAQGIMVNTQRWTTLVVEGGVATRMRCRQQPCGATQDRVPSTLRVPASAKPDPRYDGWMTVIQGDDAYDLWRARRMADGSISFAFARRWSLSGSGAGVPDRAAVRGSGLPLFAGLITADELRRGQIDHALAIALPSPASGRTVAPASATNGGGPEQAVAQGARLRLRADVLPARLGPGDRRLTRQQERARDAMLVALRRYGAIVVDRSTVPSLYARSGISTDTLFGDELAGLNVEDFELVEAPTRPSSSSSQEVSS